MKNINELFNREIISRIKDHSETILSGALADKEYAKACGYLSGLKDSLVILDEIWKSQNKVLEDF